MTQITPQELAQVVGPMDQQDAAASGMMSGIEGLMLGAVFLVGLAVGMLLHKLRGNSSRSGMDDRNHDHS